MSESNRNAGLFSRVGLRGKTLLAFGALQVIIVVMVAISFTTNRGVAEDVDSFADAVALAEVVEELDRSIVELRGRARTYFLSGNEIDREQGLKIAEEAVKGAAAAAQAASPATLQEMTAIQRVVLSVNEQFNEFVIARGQLENILDDLKTNGAQMVHELEDLQVTAAQEGASSTVILAGTAIELALELELAVNLMLSRHQAEEAEHAA